MVCLALKYEILTLNPCLRISSLDAVSMFVNSCFGLWIVGILVKLYKSFGLWIVGILVKSYKSFGLWIVGIVLNKKKVLDCDRLLWLNKK